MENFKKNLLAVIALLALLAAASKVKADEPTPTLRQSVQVVGGAEINAEALADAIIVRVIRDIGGRVGVSVDVVPNRTTSTISSTISAIVVADRLTPSNIWRVRMIVERAIRAPGVVRNGYHTILQRTHRAFSLL